ncbi:MAG: BatD family protein [Polyangiaceae bacterium]|nr:BatD family protein [Polyangiaceae bacterium]
MSRVVALALFFAGWLAALAARAQGAPDVRIEADATVVGVGDTVHLRMTATSPDVMPSDPRPGATPGFTVRGQSASPSQTHMSINGVTSDRYTLSVDWALQATKVGSYEVGPASVVVGHARVTARAVALRVVAAGQAPPRQRPMGGLPSPFGLSPFDPWRSLFPDLGVEPNQGPAPPPPVDPRYALDAPRGQNVFLHATIDKAAAVVGEQVTFSVYLYVDAGAPNLEQDDPHEAAADDFVKHPLLREDQDPQQVGLAQVGGRIWRVLLVRRWALFPLHTGDLAIGPMTVRISQGRGGPASTRASESLHVQVTEPPVAGRPPGYTIGDVGRFGLTAQVQPRDAAQGGAVGVHVELSGSGNLPSMIATPGRGDVEWLPPEVHDKVGPTGQDTYGGTRSFDYVVRMKRAGAIDLGEIRLPFWNPEKKKYEVARTSLGVVNVAPGAPSAAAPAETAPEPLAGLPAVRDRLEGSISPGRHFDDAPVFWWLAVAGAPLAFGLSVLGRAAGSRAAEAYRRRRASPLAELEERMVLARAAGSRTDARAIDAAVARAVEAATLAHARVNVRGAAGAGEITERLDRGGVSRELAERVGELLWRCEDARFSPEAADLAGARDRWSRAQRIIRELGRRG